MSDMGFREHFIPGKNRRDGKPDFSSDVIGR